VKFSELKSIIGNIPADAAKICIDYKKNESSTINNLQDILVSAIQAYHNNDTHDLLYYISMAQSEVESDIRFFDGSTNMMKTFIDSIFRDTEEIFLTSLNNSLEEKDVSELFNQVQEYLIDPEYIAEHLDWVGTIACFKLVIDHRPAFSYDMQVVQQHVNKYLDTKLCWMFYNQLYKSETGEERITYYLSLPLEKNIRGQDRSIIKCMRALHSGNMDEVKVHYDRLMQILDHIYENAPNNGDEENRVYTISYVFRFALYHCTYDVSRNFFHMIPRVPLEYIDTVVSPIIPDGKSYPYSNKLCCILSDRFPDKRYIYFNRWREITNNTTSASYNLMLTSLR
jgi:hypothetical protein